MSAVDKAIEYARQNEKRFHEEWFELLRIPSISAEPERFDEVVRAMEFDKRMLEELGFRTEVIPTRAHPALLAERIEDPSLPTVLVYGHVDVQPVDPIDLWKTPPFEPTVRDGAVWARGANDNKGQHFIHLKAVESILKTEGKLPVNIKFLIEGDEESDGEALEMVLPGLKEKLACDVVLISDSNMFEPNIPAILIGLRGIQAAEIVVRGPETDKHSGEYGGILYEPVDALTFILRSLKDYRTGHVKIPGFYDDVREISRDQREMIRSLPYDAEDVARKMGAKRLFQEEGYSYLESNWFRPTAQTNGIVGGHTGEGMKTVIGCVARAKVSFRLVKNQDPDKIFRLFKDYVESLVSEDVAVEVIKYGSGKPFFATPDDPYVRAGAKALEAGYGRKAVYIGEGASIPIVTPFAEVLGVPVVLMGFGLMTDGLHAPNEHFRLDQFEGGIRSAIHYFHEVAPKS
jgi:acetylornithine deacetylase/succinyl-diaminopimelate desuccinylase-like protein